MKIILSLLLVFSSPVFAEQDWSKWLNAVGGTGQSIGSQIAAQQEIKKQLAQLEGKLTGYGVTDSCIDCDTLKTYTKDTLAPAPSSGTCYDPSGNWVVDNEDNDSDTYRVTCDGEEIKKDNPITPPPQNQAADKYKDECSKCCNSYSNFLSCIKEKCKKTSGVANDIITGIQERQATCKTYTDLKKNKALLWQVAGDLLNVGLQIGGAALAPGCEAYCKDYSGADQVRCYCSHTGRDGKPCKEPTSSECTAVATESCADQIAKLGLASPDPLLTLSCECGKRNSVDPRGGWAVNDKGVCVNNNNNNNNNNNTEPSPFDAAYEKTAAASGANANNNTATTAAIPDAKTSGASSKMSLGGSAGGKAASGNNNNTKDKAGLPADTGRGAAKSSSALASGGGDASGRGGNEQSFKAKKGEKVKDIAKADGETIFVLVSAIYKTQVDANALDSTRPMKKIDRKIPTTTKTRGKKA